MRQILNWLHICRYADTKFRTLFIYIRNSFRTLFISIRNSLRTSRLRCLCLSKFVTPHSAVVSKVWPEPAGLGTKSPSFVLSVVPSKHIKKYIINSKMFVKKFVYLRLLININLINMGLIFGTFFCFYKNKYSVIFNGITRWGFTNLEKVIPLTTVVHRATKVHLGAYWVGPRRGSSKYLPFCLNFSCRLI